MTRDLDRTDSLSHPEGDLLTSGKGLFIGDIRFANMLHLVLVRSQAVVGDLIDIDLSASLRQADVSDAFSARDVPEYLQPIPSRVPIPHAALPYLQPPLALEDVRYVGQPVAAIIGASPDAAHNAADLAQVEILPRALSEPEEILSESVIFDDVDRVIANADVVVHDQFSIARQAAAPLETRGIIADYRGATLHLWLATKAPRHTQITLARALHLQPHRVRIHAVPAGGGFGVRGELHPEDIVVAIASIRSGRPVRWIETRTEHFLGSYQSRGMKAHARLAMRSDGTLLALDAEFSSDLGAYVGPNGLTVGRIALRAFIGPYRVPAYRCIVHHSISNKVPLGTMRAPGYLESAFVRERLMDMAATELGLSPVDVRLHNLIDASEMPYRSAGGSVYDDGRYVEPLKRVVNHVRRNDDGADDSQGVGFSCVVEGTGTPGTESARAHLANDGRITLTVASSSLGQGHKTAFGGLLARAIGVPLSMIDVVEGESDYTDAHGGTYASRSAIMMGNACSNVANALVEKLLAIGRRALGTEVALIDGAVRPVDGSADPVDLSRLAPVDARASFSCSETSFSYGAGAARVIFDSETGQIILTDLIVAVDCGAALDHALVRGQLLGGAAHGVGSVLHERVPYSADGEPLIVGFRDYHVPRICDLPRIDVLALELVPSSTNPLGVRGVGEIGTTIAATAVANAVSSAVSRHGLQVTALPVTHDMLANRPSSHLGNGPVVARGMRPRYTTPEDAGYVDY